MCRFYLDVQTQQDFEKMLVYLHTLIGLELILNKNKIKVSRYVGTYLFNFQFQRSKLVSLFDVNFAVVLTPQTSSHIMLEVES